MKSIIYTACIGVLLASCANESAEKEEVSTPVTKVEIVEATTTETETPKKPKSPRKQTAGEINGVAVSLDYGSPYVKGRTIWGDLVPYGKLWRAGANETTSISFEGDVVINNTSVVAGTYALFVLPSEHENWTVVINEQWSEEEHDVWGTYGYDKDKDVVRFEVTPLSGDELVESLTYEIENNMVHFAWEYLSFAFTVD